MAIVKFHTGLRRLLLIVALLGLVREGTADGQIRLSPGQVPVIDNELNSPVDEPQVTIEEHSSNAVMRPVPPEILQSTDPLVRLVYDTREAQRRRLLSTEDHTPWQIMHGMLALRQDFLIRHEGKPVNCLEWIQSGPLFERESWFEKTQVQVFTGRGGNQAYQMMMVGRGHPYNKAYAFEGHINQFVAILSMSGIPLETQFQTPQGPVSMRDMLNYAKLTVNDREEVTWTLWALSRYLPSDAEWLNSRGEKWSIERLVKTEVGKSLNGAPCGGTHGLFALAHARNVYLRSGKPMVGVWLEAEQKIRRYIQTARMQQNSDGTLSSNYFRGREFKPAFDKRMASSGHLLEFLMMAIPSRELNDPWIRRAIEATSNDLMANRKSFVSCSPLYHATSALSIYLDRVAKPVANMAQGAPKTQTISSSKELKTVDAAAGHPDAVKCPVLESSGVDSSGAPKQFTGPTLKTPEAPEKTTPESTVKTSEPMKLPVTPTEPVPTEPVAAEPAPSEPATSVPAPSEPAPSVQVPSEPATPVPATSSSEPSSAEPLRKPPEMVDPLVPMPAKPTTDPGDSQRPFPLTIPTQSEAIVVQPQSPNGLVPAPHESLTSTHHSTKVVSTSKLLVVGPQAPVAKQPAKAILAALGLPKGKSDQIPSCVPVLPMALAPSIPILPNEPTITPSVSDEPLAAPKKTPCWKPTPVERKTAIDVETKPTNS